MNLIKLLLILVSRAPCLCSRDDSKHSLLVSCANSERDLDSLHFPSAHQPQSLCLQGKRPPWYYCPFKTTLWKSPLLGEYGISKEANKIVFSLLSDECRCLGWAPMCFKDTKMHMIRFETLRTCLYFWKPIPRWFNATRL